MPGKPAAGQRFPAITKVVHTRALAQYSLPRYSGFQVMVNAFVVINPVSGSLSDGKTFRTMLSQRLDDARWRYSIHETQENDDLSAVVRDACERGVTLVIVAGGDGTVGEVVNGMVGTTVPLGLVPVGTGNLFARAVGVPLRWEEALALIIGEHRVIGVDSMYAAGRHCILNISTGISSSSIYDTPRKDKRRFGILAYVWRVVGHIFGFKSYRFDLLLDGYLRTVDATELFVSNGTMVEDLPNLLGPQPTYCDGRIDVYVVNGRSVYDYLVIILRTIFRRPARDEKFIHFSVFKRMTITAHRKSRLVQGDGEVISTTPVEIEVVPAAVRIIVPDRE